MVGPVSVVQTVVSWVMFAPPVAGVTCTR
jgi:hypothetical protein